MVDLTYYEFYFHPIDDYLGCHQNLPSIYEYYINLNIDSMLHQILSRHLQPFFI